MPTIAFLFALLLWRHLVMLGDFLDYIYNCKLYQLALNLTWRQITKCLCVGDLFKLVQQKVEAVTLQLCGVISLRNFFNIRRLQVNVLPNNHAAFSSSTPFSM